MSFNIFEEKGKIIVEGLADFELPHIFECGQCFRWNKESDNSYTGVAKGRVINVCKKENKVIFDNTSKDDFLNIWVDYFDLYRDYGRIKKVLAKKDTVMKDAVMHGFGIRILNQDEWETLISFIISSNRGIPLIKKSIEALCKKYGNFIGEYKGKEYYDFPSAEVLQSKSVEEIKESHTGYRAKYIVDTAAMIAKKEIDIYHLKNLSTEDARKELMRCSGVGPKVADCILLFSMGKFDAFPTDVWVKRIVEYFYLKEESSFKRIQEFAKEKFKKDAGFAQQYLFYYARALGIGK
ncbi:DNA-3-methyladenine glycosylase 2 family protein [Crassaminicella thermophila]|uniref:DNA-(apurinic or apyrimidinic site) lyase n=1 Tax=Crassaminicella thermophila TaxID=2599308 RepID=A0A5C0SH90_CRATE|nr:DNA glycosylase [Crassaminicella thermophila]QEK13096.1 DNA-3-methyladenine glycosylase 2 family protein [Crassaminicella thermophila]